MGKAVKENRATEMGSKQQFEHLPVQQMASSRSSLRLRYSNFFERADARYTRKICLSGWEADRCLSDFLWNEITSSWSSCLSDSVNRLRKALVRSGRSLDVVSLDGTGVGCARLANWEACMSSRETVRAWSSISFPPRE